MSKVKANFQGQKIFVGMDVHKSSWNLGIYLNDMFIKNVHQKPNPRIMANYLQTQYPGPLIKRSMKRGSLVFGYNVSLRNWA